jgi:hypothetical protein
VITSSSTKRLLLPLSTCRVCILRCCHTEASGLFSQRFWCPQVHVPVPARHLHDRIQGAPAGKQCCICNLSVTQRCVKLLTLPDISHHLQLDEESSHCCRNVPLGPARSGMNLPGVVACTFVCLGASWRTSVQSESCPQNSSIVLLVHARPLVRRVSWCDENHQRNSHDGLLSITLLRSLELV